MVLKRVALTGGSGLMGSHLLPLLADGGIEALAPSRREWNLADWRSPEELDRLFPGAEALIHAGALVPEGDAGADRRELLDVNVRASVCLGDWARRKGIPLVFVSSATVYADPHKPGIAESDAKASAPGLGGFYAFSKLAAEQSLQFLAGEGLSLCVLRPSSLYGTGMKNGLVARFLAAAQRGETLRLAPPLDDRVNLLHASDAAAAALGALRSGARGVFNIAAASETGVLDLARACVEAAGQGSVATEPVAGRPPFVRFSLACAAARAAFGFQPRVELREGLARMAAGRR